MDNNKTKKEFETETSQLGSRVLTVPNILSFIRIILINPFVIFFLDEDYLSAAGIVTLSGLTDCVDGFIARRFHQESELGKLLDPLADKLTLVAVGICLIVVEPIVLPVMIVLIIKDLAMIIGGSIVVKKGVLVPKSKWYGKLGTILFYITVTFIVLTKITHTMNNALYILPADTAHNISLCLMILTVAVMIYSLVRYAMIFVQIMRKIKAQPVSEDSVVDGKQ